MKFYQHGSNFRQKIQVVLEYVSGRVTKYTPPSPPLSQHKGLRDIGHSMSIRNLILGVNSVTVSYIIDYDNLLQNATGIITKFNSYFIIKCDKSLLQNVSGFLLQNATVITKCDVYYILRQYTHQSYSFE